MHDLIIKLIKILVLHEAHPDIEKVNVKLRSLFIPKTARSKIIILIF